MLTRLTICSLCILTICNISYFRFGFEGWSWVLIASVPDLCLLFYLYCFIMAASKYIWIIVYIKTTNTNIFLFKCIHEYSNMNALLNTSIKEIGVIVLKLYCK